MNLQDIKGRIEAMEEDCQAEIPDGLPLPMTSHVILEARWLVEKLKDLRRHNSNVPRAAGSKHGDGAKVEEELKAIDQRVAALEKRFRSAIVIGKFSQISTSIIPDMRYMVDQIELAHSKRKGAKPKDAEFEPEASEPEASEPAIA